MKENNINRRELIKKMFLEDDMSVEEIASKLGVSNAFVKEDLLMLGINPSHPKNLIKKLLEMEGKKRNYNLEDIMSLETRLKIADLLLKRRSKHG